MCKTAISYLKMGSSKINRKSVGEGENEGRRDVCGQRTRMKRGDDREHCSNAMHATGTAGKKMPASIRCRLMLHVRTFTVISDKSNTITKSVYVCTVSMLFIAALLLRVWLAIPVGYGFGSAPGQDPSPRALHH